MGQGLGGVETELRRSAWVTRSSTRSRTTTLVRTPCALAVLRTRDYSRSRQPSSPPRSPSSPRARWPFPSETRKLLALRDELSSRGLGYLLDTWRCDDEARCDPCGPTAGAPDSWGAWHYVACRVTPSGSAPPRRRVPENARRRDENRRRRGDDVFRGDERAPQRLEHRRHVREPAARLVSVLAPARARPGRRPSGRFDAGVARRVLPELQELDLSHNRAWRARFGARRGV